MLQLEKYMCPDCGGSLQLEADGKRAVCRYCGNEFFFKEDKTEALVLALNNANEHLKRNDFDNAIDQYTAIWKKYPNDPEAAWGVALSTYGIVYAYDDKTGKMVPTCSRIIKESILENAAYLSAISQSTEEQRAIYRQKAIAIDTLQQKIKRAMENEQDFEVFISFKARDESGIATEDSVIARKIYDELTAQGIKAFFSEVTLRNRLGDEFEPIIYRALYSCKFFILVSTKEEYLNAPWVKNEWTRFRDRIAEENLSGACTAAFKNISPYSLPRVFQNQGIDLEKHPFDYAVLIADNLAAKFGKRKQFQAAPVGSSPQYEDKTQPLLKRAFLFLEDKNFTSANEYCEKVLDIDPENAEAYLGKLMCDLKIAKRNDLWRASRPFSENNNFKKVIRFGNDALRQEVQEQLARVKPPIETPRPRPTPTTTTTTGRTGPVSPPISAYSPPVSEKKLEQQVKKEKSIRYMLIIGILLLCTVVVAAYGVILLVVRHFVIKNKVKKLKASNNSQHFSNIHL